MQPIAIKNVVFDVGNVLVRWSPLEIVRLTFGNNVDAEGLAKELFMSSIWSDLNKGLISESQAKQRYQEEKQFSEADCERFFYYVKQTQLLIYGSVDLLKRIKTAGYQVYALTDNVVEIVEYLKSTYDFWPLFNGTTVSAELGLLKPQPEIYQNLLKTHHLLASETVFLDDMPHNVEGAQAVGILAIQFEHAEQCERALKAMGLSFSSNRSK
ncbi:haloacid dehalogenase [Vibrio hyugaensis]|uniref:Haloacid dehalogenase n=2 Tax=Vibrio hyugaensis TaxID=1534743 RepID=A0ABQ5Y728_9VIBR|nr:HAD family phosphatase [Vibrio hyugaensis]GLR04890.1 haloacid dehalogenase [Vibrio hyugaensis]